MSGIEQELKIVANDTIKLSRDKKYPVKIHFLDGTKYKPNSNCTAY